MMREQAVYRGTGAIRELKGILEKQGARKLFLVAGSLAASDTMKAVWSATGIPYVLFRDFSPNPRYEEVENALQKFRTEGCNAVAGMGGGSAIDVAKCVKYFSQTPERDDIGLTAIPTTAGTGSEATRFAVVYKQGKKQSIDHESIVPDAVILDGGYLKGLPEYQKKATLLDALCQAVESQWSIHATDESRGFASQAISLILSNQKDYLAGDVSRNQALLEAAYLSGKAINLTQTTAAHAMSYQITSLFSLAHGHAVALCLPYVWKYLCQHMESCIDPRGAAHLSEVMLELSRAFGGREIEDGYRQFLNLIREMRMEERRTISDRQLSDLTDSVNLKRLKNTPVELSKETLRELYRNIFRIEDTPASAGL